MIDLVYLKHFFINLSLERQVLLIL